MNLTPYYRKQKELDELIADTNDVTPAEVIRKKIIAAGVELGEFLNEKPSLFKYWSNKPDNDEKALVEFVDTLHFVLSIGNAIDYHHNPVKIQSYELDALVIGLQFNIALLSVNKDMYPVVVDSLFELAKRAGFSYEQIEDAYDRKYEVNVERQKVGY